MTDLEKSQRMEHLEEQHTAWKFENGELVVDEDFDDFGYDDIDDLDLEEE